MPPVPIALSSTIMTALEPGDETIACRFFDGATEAADGCVVEPDRICPRCSASG